MLTPEVEAGAAKVKKAVPCRIRGLPGGVLRLQIIRDQRVQSVVLRHVLEEVLLTPSAEHPAGGLFAAQILAVWIIYAMLFACR